MKLKVPIMSKKKLSRDEIAGLTRNRMQYRYPWKLERSYATIMSKYIYSLEKTAKTFVNMYIKHYVSGGVATLNDDDKHKDDINSHHGEEWYKNIAKSLALLVVLIEREDVPEYVKQEVVKFVASVDGYSLATVKMQVGAIGLNPIVSDNAIKDMLQGKISYNVSLIKSMKSKYAHDLENDIYRSLENGGGIGSITEAIVRRTGMSIKHARLIATDQTGKILGQLNAYRATKAGAKYYIWQSMEDNRVRPAHRELDQTVQKYNDPAGGDGGQMPGEPINCRCVSLPVFDDDTVADYE